jgi:antibiotic biosynthesis monooxygenase (ABM) superfamily enzyme
MNDERTTAGLAPEAARTQPNRFRLTLVVWSAVYVLLTSLLLLLDPLIHGWPLPLRTMFATALVVPTLTYGILPTAHKRLAGWLHGGGRNR